MEEFYICKQCESEISENDAQINNAECSNCRSKTIKHATKPNLQATAQRPVGLYKNRGSNGYN